MKLSESQKLRILALVKSEKMIRFINASASEHSLQAAVSRLINNVVNDPSSPDIVPINFEQYIYGHDSSPIAQDDSEEDIVVKALLVGVSTKKHLNLINGVIDDMVDSFGLRELFDNLLSEKL